MNFIETFLTTILYVIICVLSVTLQFFVTKVLKSQSASGKLKQKMEISQERINVRFSEDGAAG